MVLIAGFAAGVGTAVTVIGLPILAGALFVARFFADIERRAIAPRPAAAAGPPDLQAGRTGRRLVAPVF